MSRYVDIEPYDDCRIVLNSEDQGFPCRIIPTADVEKVRHGKWLKNAGKPTCNQCGEVNYLEPNFCPKCGARMDGGEKE